MRPDERPGSVEEFRKALLVGAPGKSGSDSTVKKLFVSLLLLFSVGVGALLVSGQLPEEMKRLLGLTPPPPVACSTPWGASVADGSSVDAFLADKVPAGGVCSAQTRVCTNGALSGSYTHSACRALSPASCTTPWGATVAHGNGVPAFLARTVASDDTCSVETRFCSDGKLSGTYGYEACSVSAPPASCTTPWGAAIAHGASVQAFLADTSSSGEACALETRTCTDGVLSGSYTSQACKVCRLVVETQKRCETKNRNEQRCGPESKTKTVSTSDTEPLFGQFRSQAAAERFCVKEVEKMGKVKMELKQQCNGTLGSVSADCSCSWDGISPAASCNYDAEADCDYTQNVCRTVQVPYQDCPEVNVPRQVCE